MKIIEIQNNPKLKEEFLLFPVRLYKDDKNWIRPLDEDIEMVFDPARNLFFGHGVCNRWLLQDEAGETIGRVAAFINEYNVLTDNLQPTGGMGFFECIESLEAAFLLFDTCKNWLAERGMEAMDGPINFGERNKWWGLLVEGFFPPSYCIPYHKKYYKKFFEQYGFLDYFQQYTYVREIAIPITHQGLLMRTERIIKQKEYHFEHVKFSNIEKYIEDFRIVFNAAWAGSISGVSEMSPEQMQSVFKQLRPIVDTRLIWFAYYEEEPIAFFAMIPEINQILKKLNGKLDFFGKLKFKYYQWRGVCDKILGLAFGVVPKFQRRGVETALIVAFTDFIQNDKTSPYKDIELNWIGDFNPRMTKLVEMLGFTLHKVHITYRKLFKAEQPFQRASITR